MKQGDIVLNPKNHGAKNCVILRIKESKAILSPFTKRGYPSCDTKRWLSSPVSKLIRSKKWPSIATCPKCPTKTCLRDEDKRVLQILNTPLRWPNIYIPKMQCKRCKKWFKSIEQL